MTVNFGIVGPVAKDHVVLPTGERINKFGAIAYSAVALAKLVEDTSDQVICLTHVAAGDMEAVGQLLQHPNIVLAGKSSHADERGTEIELTYIDQKERRSRQISFMSPITEQECGLLAECQAILLMPLNETDIPLACAKTIKRLSDATIFLDVHGLVTQLDEQGRRFNQQWQNREEWFSCIDILKMNAKEAPWVAGRYLESDEEFVEYAASVIRAGLAICWITFGDQSSLLAWRRGNRILWAKVPVTDVAAVVDTTGCGDSASAGFLYSYALLYNPLIAVVMGNTLGSLKASFQGVQGFPSKPEVRGIIYHHYRDYLHELLDDFLSKGQFIVHEMKEECSNEGVVLDPDGIWHRYGPDDESGSHRQSPAAPWS